MSPEHQRIFDALPALTSPEYLQLLTTASARDLPAPVLVRALRDLSTVAGPAPDRLCRAAELTLDRLVTREAEFGYLRPLRDKAKAMARSQGSADVDDLIFDAKQEVMLALIDNDRSKGAEDYWVRFQLQRLTNAWRNRYGRRGERLEPERVGPTVDPDSGKEVDPLDGVTGEEAPWHGRIKPDIAEWLYPLVQRTMAAVGHEGIRIVGQDQFGPNPSKMWSADENDTSTLAHRLGVDRHQIARWRESARAKIAAAIQRERRDLDLYLD